MVRLLRRLLWAVLALLGVALLVAVVWAATQGPDAAPRPRPAALQLPPAAPPGPVYTALVALGQSSGGNLGPPLNCGRGQDCAERWSRDVAAVTAELARHRALGERCQAVQAVWRREGPYVEWVPERLGPSQPMPLFGGLAPCQRWLIGRALEAAAAGDEPAALARLRESREWALGQLEGARSLIGHLVAYAQVTLHLQAVAAVAVLQPGWAAALEPSVAPWPDAWMNPARWMPHEAAFGRGVLDELDAQCRGDARTEAPAAVAGQQPATATDLLLTLCRRGLGWHPEATRQAADAVWVARIERLQQGPVAWLEDAAGQRARARASGESPGPPLRWRNTYGHWLVSLGQDDRLYDGYVANPADVAMHRQLLAATLALRRAGVPVADRSAWLARHGGLPPEVWRRAGWEPDGRALRWLTWADELRVGGSPTEPSVPFRIPLEVDR